MSASKNNLSQLTNKGCLNPITNLSLLLDLARADFTRLTPTEATRESSKQPLVSLKMFLSSATNGQANEIKNSFRYSTLLTLQGLE